ncbi:hypothetical protein IWQ49_000058 [Labrenzia sp. EL_126]|nr:hypothetical protein [Labrenzia sp. EL_126]
MTASIQNTRSSFAVLKKGIAWFKSNTKQTPQERVWHVEILLDSFEKCMESLAAQIRFYQSAKSPTRALLIKHEDGRSEYLSGQCVETLCLHLPDQSQDVVVYGKPTALRELAKALSQSGERVTGPHSIHSHAQELAGLSDTEGRDE